MMNVGQLRTLLENVPSTWEVMFEYEDSTQEEVVTEGSFDIDEVVFVFTFGHELIVLRSVD
jgi:hypothetical protein